MVAVQASSQLDTVYGAVYANELRDIFPASVIMFGAREEELHGGRALVGTDQPTAARVRAERRWQEPQQRSRCHSALAGAPATDPRTCAAADPRRGGNLRRNTGLVSLFTVYDQTTQAILARAHGRDGSAGAVEQEASPHGAACVAGSRQCGVTLSLHVGSTCFSTSCIRARSRR